MEAYSPAGVSGPSGGPTCQWKEAESNRPESRALEDQKPEVEIPRLRPWIGTPKRNRSNEHLLCSRHLPPLPLHETARRSSARRTAAAATTTTPPPVPFRRGDGPLPRRGLRAAAQPRARQVRPRRRGRERGLPAPARRGTLPKRGVEGEGMARGRCQLPPPRGRRLRSAPRGPERGRSCAVRPPRRPRRPARLQFAGPEGFLRVVGRKGGSRPELRPVAQQGPALPPRPADCPRQRQAPLLEQPRHRRCQERRRDHDDAVEGRGHPFDPGAAAPPASTSTSGEFAIISPFNSSAPCVHPVNGLLGTPSQRGCFFFRSIFAITATETLNSSLRLKED